MNIFTDALFVSTALNYKKYIYYVGNNYIDFKILTSNGYDVITEQQYITKDTICVNESSSSICENHISMYYKPHYNKDFVASLNTLYIVSNIKENTRPINMEDSNKYIFTCSNNFISLDEFKIVIYRLVRENLIIDDCLFNQIRNYLIKYQNYRPPFLNFDDYIEDNKNLQLTPVDYVFY